VNPIFGSIIIVLCQNHHLNKLDKDYVIMQIDLAKRMQSIKPSPTLAISAKAAELKAAGKDIVNLSVGEPDFDTPEHIKKAAIQAINQGFTKYTAVDGIPELKQAIIAKFKHENQLNYEPSQILVSSGGKQSFFNMALALLQTGDEAIIPAPYWVSYPDMVAITGATPVIVPTTENDQFKMTPEALQKALTPKTKLIVINSPSNPSGLAYSKEELEALAAVILKHPTALVATDDMYEHILWAKRFHNIVNVCPELYERTIVLNGVSKAYSMTGWRIGYCGGPKSLINAMKDVQSQSTSNPCSIAQKAAVAALTGGNDCIIEMINAFIARHDYLVDALNKLPGVKTLASDGTFYSFPNVEKAMASLKLTTDVDFCNYLLDHGVAVVPGSAFGTPGHIRLSFATSMENLKKAIERMEKASTAS
jgi:aspartate aminotransferase